VHASRGTVGARKASQRNDSVSLAWLDVRLEDGEQRGELSADAPHVSNPRGGREN